MPKKFIRKRNRLPFKELYQGGHWYFVTVCVQDRKCIFVEESPRFPKSQSKDTPNPQPNQNFVLNQNGQIVKQEWLASLNFYENIILDEFVIMPNHFHAIIGFDGLPVSKLTQKPTDLSKIISAFKSSSYRKIKSHNGRQGPSSTSTDFLIQKYNSIWQKSFNDHIIRNDKDLDRIREYILYNPLNWHLDEFNPVDFEK